MSLTPQEARLRLAAARHDGSDDADPEVAEALALARRDPELAAWLAAERRSDALLSAALASVEPPADLKAAILARGAEAFRENRERAAVRRRLKAALFAFAAAFAVAAFVALRPGPNSNPAAAPVADAAPAAPVPVSYVHYEDSLAEQIACGEVTQLEAENPSPDVLRQWLAAHHAPSAIAIPRGLRPRPSLGCRTFDWEGRRVGQVCFVIAGGKIVHLFVVEKAGWMPDTAPPQGKDAPQFNRHGGWTLASWREGTTTYVLAGEGDPEALRKLL
ncbi:MAG TPA: hypothetical protein VIM58_11070 [Candidatus Methylacidiphilales bacterium]